MTAYTRAVQTDVRKSMSPPNRQDVPIHNRHEYLQGYLQNV